MSKNLTIKEGGVAKQLTVDKLKTNLVSGGTCLWVPEDEVQLTTKTITENGIYKASDDGHYGYSKVIVNIANAGTATGTDGDGDEAVAYTDPTTGGLIEEKVPSSIEVITPPTTPYGIYTNGQTITTEGMVVKAYFASGGEYGTVLNGEITLNPTTAIYDATTDRPSESQATSNLDTSPLSQPIIFSNYVEVISETETFVLSAPVVIIYHSTGDNIGFILGGTVGASYSYVTRRISTGDIINSESGTFVEAQYTYDNKSVSFIYGGGNHGANPVLSIDSNPNNVNTSVFSTKRGPIIWTCVYGEVETERAGSRQQITVSWPRPHDGKVLETTFEILVAPGYTPGGGSTVENGHGGGGGSF